MYLYTPKWTNTLKLFITYIILSSMLILITIYIYTARKVMCIPLIHQVELRKSIPGNSRKQYKLHLETTHEFLIPLYCFTMNPGLHKNLCKVLSTISVSSENIYFSFLSFLVFLFSSFLIFPFLLLLVYRTITLRLTLFLE